MTENVYAEVLRLRAMTVGELRTRYAEVFGEAARSRNKDYLWKRIAYRIQEVSEGGVSDRAKRRAEELARDADLRMTPPKQAPLPMTPPSVKRDPRLPPPGSTLTRAYAGQNIHVRVLETGFEFEGKEFATLSTIAREVTGTKWNGFVFFGLGSGGGVG